MSGHPPIHRFKPGTVKRLFGYMAAYRAQMIFVIICIIVSAGAGAGASLFLKTLIDGYIVPLLGQANPEFSSLLHAGGSL